MYNFEDCKNNIVTLTEWYSTNQGARNEATTRFQLIDRIFFECLSWSKDDVIMEESESGLFADYTFNNPRRILIVEAKKEGLFFELPLSYSRTEYSIRSLIQMSEDIKKAIEQVTSYCQQRGVPLAVVTNGHQIIAFVASKIDGNSPYDGKALVFSSFEVMISNFVLLWNSLSKSGVEENYLIHKLTGDIIINLPPKLSSKIQEYPGHRIRNIFQTDLQIVSDLVFEDLTRAKEIEKQFLEECYCESGALSQYSLASKNILNSRYAALFDTGTSDPAIVPANSKDGLSASLLAESLSRRPILLVGDVGVGKTTFIRNLIEVKAAEAFENAITLYIDLGAQGTLTDSLKNFILNEIKRQLLDKYATDIDDGSFIKGVYYSEIQRFTKSIYAAYLDTNPELYKQKQIESIERLISQPEQHLKKSLEHLEKARKRQIVLIIDNADQRTESIQQEAFLIAQEFSEYWPATVFVALRPETYNYSVKQGALSGYHPKAFSISPPRIDNVLSKRLAFALKITNGDIPIKALPPNATVQFQKLKEIIQVFIMSLERSNELLEFIDNIAAGNVRVALDLVRGFFGSGHVNTEKILDIYTKTGSYFVPLHEFLRAVIFGDYEYYYPQFHNTIANLFDISAHDLKEHFLLIFVIALASSTAVRGETGGFIETSKIYSELQSLGYTPEQIDFAIIKGNNNKLIEVEGRKAFSLGMEIPHSIRATTTGLYHINKLVSSFTYIDAIIVDTIILDEKVISKMHNEKEINERLKMAELFKSYLDKAWDTIPSAKTFYDWTELSETLQKDIERIKRKLVMS